MSPSLQLCLGIGCVPLNHKELVSSLAGIWEAYGLVQMCACVMLPFLRVQTTACGSWLTLCLSNFCSTFSNVEETEMKLLLTSLLVPWRMYYKDLMVCRVPTRVRKILTYMFWDSNFFLPHFQLWQDVKNEKGFSTAKPVKILPLSLSFWSSENLLLFLSDANHLVYLFYYDLSEYYWKLHIYWKNHDYNDFQVKIYNYLMRERFFKVLVNYLLVNISLLNL